MITNQEVDELKRDLGEAANRCIDLVMRLTKMQADRAFPNELHDSHVHAYNENKRRLAEMAD